MRYRYRKITPENIESMKEMRDEGQTYKKIAEFFEVSMSVVQYHLIPEYKESSLKRANESNKRRGPPKRDPEYIKKYIKDRYHNDEEFRKRYVGLVIASHKRRKVKWLENGLCSGCGKERLDKKFKTCEICRSKKRIKYEKNKSEN